MDCRLYQQPLFRKASGEEFRPGGLELTDELALECGISAGTTVLDLACGVGSTATHLAAKWGAQVTGLDASSEFVDEARARCAHVSWLVGHADAIPIADAVFDVVFCECFLSVADEPGAVLREAHRVLRPGGLLALSDLYLRGPEVAEPPGNVGAGTCLRYARSEEASLALLRSAGFAVRVWRDKSESLKGLFASLIMSYGSASAFWAAAGCDDDYVSDWVELARPGYCLLVAEAVAVPLDGSAP